MIVNLWNQFVFDYALVYNSKVLDCMPGLLGEVASLSICHKFYDVILLFENEYNFCVVFM